VIVRSEKSPIPLFDRTQDHSSVPTMPVTAIARSGGPGRPRGRRDGASPLTAASTMATLRCLGAMVCMVATFASSIELNVAAHAERAVSVTHQEKGRAIDPLAGFITEASKRFAVPEHWIRSVMRVESAGEVRARSQKGAMGLMQIMPQTWSELRARYDLGPDPYAPRDNILAGTAYIRELYQRFGAPGFLAAYNAGPTRYENHLATGRSLPDETQDYVAILAPMIGGKRVNGKIVAVAESLTLARSPLFVVRCANSSFQRSPSIWGAARSSIKRSSCCRSIRSLAAVGQLVCAPCQ
jgi:hypothetical protein